MIYKKYFLIIIIIFILKLATLGLYDFPHLTEIRYSSIAMRMALTGNYLMPFFTPEVPFLGKPPLFLWATAISFKIFGFNEFAGRLPHYLALVATCLFSYISVKRIYNAETAIITILILLSCSLFYLLQSVMTESFLLLGMTMITLSFFVQIRSQQPKTIYGYWFFIGAIIAMLTKGPVGIFIPCLSIAAYLTYKSRWQEVFKKFPIITGTIIFICLTVPWFLLAEYKYHGFLRYFILGENLSRFLKPGWNGDRYGRAHHVAFGTIWIYFILATLPAILLFFAKPKNMFITAIQNIKKDDAFLFFILNIFIPLILLTFMRNMIFTYAIYSLIPFAIITSRILALKNWHKFIFTIGIITIILHIAAIIIFLSKIDLLNKKINYQTYLIKHIPREELDKSDFKLYYYGINNNNFSGYWIAKDRVVILRKKKLIEILNGNNPAYIVGDREFYQKLEPQYQEKLTTLICVDEKNACLYKRN